jgi:hypothetical protein
MMHTDEENRRGTQPDEELDSSAARVRSSGDTTK